MTREEKMEAGFQKAAQMYRKTPEDITYKNLFAYVMIGGIVILTFGVNFIALHCFAPLYVRVGSALPR